MRNFFLILLLATACCLHGQAQSAPDRQPRDGRPNIVLILADDMGFSDIGCYGGEIHTPNIDALAAGGIRFARFYNTSRCCPSRAQLLTGLDNHMAGIGNMTTDQHQPGYRGYLTENTVTIAEVLKTAGYHTAMAGKWHVSNTVEQPTPEMQLQWLDHQIQAPLFSPLEQYPTSRGFEKFYGTLWGVVDHFDPFSLVNGTTPVQALPAGYYHTDAISDSAASYIRQFSKDPQPFFLYLAYNAPHWPVQAPASDIEKYKDTYRVGWEAIREARYRRLAGLGIIDTATVRLSPRHPDARWEENPDAAWDARVMAVHAAMIDRMDQGIGRVVAALRQTGRLENTLIVFLSDNGASPEVAQTMPPGFDRPSTTRSGEKIIYAADKKTMPGPENVYASIGPAWANVANTPFRYWKIESYEGGTHTPFIAHWPKGIAPRKGSVIQQTATLLDIMPTVVALARAHYPSVYRGHSITPMQGLSLLPVFQNKSWKGHDLIFNEHHQGRYVRKGEWKLVSSNADTTWELYDLRHDGSELHNLATTYPEKVHTMDSCWQHWAIANKILPRPASVKVAPARATSASVAKGPSAATMASAAASVDPSPALTTPWTSRVSPHNAHSEYPRPQRVRKEWKNCNGNWDYAITPLFATIPSKWQGRILVPYPIESMLSGVQKKCGPDSLLWYHTTLVLPAAWSHQRIILHFEAVDWETKLWVNGKPIGQHRGGYDAFGFDITDAVKPGPQQDIVLSVWDPGNAGDQPNGKQYNQPRSIWYTSTTGIWQTVWLEPLPPVTIPDFTLLPDIDKKTLKIAFAKGRSLGASPTDGTASSQGGHKVSSSLLSAIAYDQGKKVAEIQGHPGDTLQLQLPSVKLWSPSNPFLYDLTITLHQAGKKMDEIHSYFGMRSIGLEKDKNGFTRLALNHQTIFQFGTLDQGFWPDGLYTAPTDSALRYDIAAQKQMGFNLIRKHVKVEPQRWYYWCDQLGMLVWQDMPSGDRHIGKQDSDIVRSEQSALQYKMELKQMIGQHFNHPSIITWVPFNEGWGQFNTREIAAFTRALDPTRLVNATSGWVDRGVGDMHDTHNYPWPAMTNPETDRATVLGEFGGQALLVKDHCWVKDLSLAPGHIRTSRTPEDLQEVYRNLIDSLVVLRDQGLSAAVYTQTTDVESEVNGLMTYDRRIWKIDSGQLRKINDRLLATNPDRPMPAGHEGQPYAQTPDRRLAPTPDGTHAQAPDRNHTLTSVGRFTQAPDRNHPSLAAGNRKLIVVTFDGYRWKDVFRGADSALFFAKIKGAKDSAQWIEECWGQNIKERREKLMPFFWKTIAQRGQVFGNRDLGSYVNVTNPYWFSYPGYNEIFTGYADTVINSNDYPANPNVTLPEFLNARPDYQGRVAAFTSWVAFERILNKDRSGFPVNAGYTEYKGPDLNGKLKLLSNEQFLLPQPFGIHERPDAITYLLAREYLAQQHPRYLQISFIETDAFGHQDKYDSYLQSARHNDAMLEDLWNYIQSDPYYKDQTTLYIATDHGRGEGGDWTHHNNKTPGSDQIWFAVMGPYTAPGGQIENTQVHQNQYARTMGALLGIDFTGTATHPAGPLIPGVIRTTGGTSEK